MKQKPIYFAMAHEDSIGTGTSPVLAFNDLQTKDDYVKLEEVSFFEAKEVQVELVLIVDINN